MLVQDASGLAKLVRALERVDEFAVDTEADSFYSYQEKVCLIQVTAGAEDYLIDPLADVDLGPLGEPLADPRKIKVFHDGEYDVLILKRDFGFSFGGLFDTRVAAAALGSEAPGLASVLEHRFGVKLDKSLQRSDWSARPLSQKQIAYARLDTHYLLALAEEQRVELESRGRLMMVEGECRRLEGLEPPSREFQPDDFIRLKGARKLRPMELQTLRELFCARDRLARERDLPPFKILGHPTLVAIAQRRPRNMQGLEQCKGLSQRQVRKFGRALLDAVHRAKDKGPLKRIPQPPSRDDVVLDEVEAELHERLKTWRKGHANREGIDSSLVLNRKVLLHLAHERPVDEEALAGIEGLLPWQLDTFGDELLDLIEEFENDVRAGRVPAPRRGSRGR